MSRPAGNLLASLFLALAVMLPATASLAAPQIVAPGGAPMQLAVGKARLIHLDGPASAIFVADPEIADVQLKSPTLVYVFGKSGGETTLFAVGERDDVLLNIAVRVSYDVARIEQAIHEIAPRSAVTVSAVDDSVVLDGTVYSAAEGDDIRRIAARFLPDPKQLVNRMKVDAPNQVNLRVRVAEMSRDTIKQFGLNWDTIFGQGKFAFGVATGRQVLDTSGKVILRGTSANGQDTLDNIFGSFVSGRADLNVLIDALDKQGIVTVLAEPNLSAVSGESASFLAGGEFPIPVPQTLGTTTVDFKKFGVSLNFVATISANNRISLRVQPEVSELSTAGAVTINGIQVPALTTRRAETTVELASGQSFAIAGLLQNNVNQNITKFPWLGDIPVLGALFRSENFQRSESELVIIVTPYVVRPVATANRLATPVEGFTASSDSDLLLKGTAYKAQVLKRGTAPVTRGATGLVGPVGFELE